MGALNQTPRRSVREESRSFSRRALRVVSPGNGKCQNTPLESTSPLKISKKGGQVDRSGLFWSCSYSRRATFRGKTHFFPFQKPPCPVHLRQKSAFPKPRALRLVPKKHPKPEKIAPDDRKEQKPPFPQSRLPPSVLPVKPDGNPEKTSVHFANGGNAGRG